MNKQIIMVGSDHYYREKINGTWKIISTKIYILDVTTKKYYFKNGMPEIIIFSHPNEDNAGWAKWCLLWADKAGLIVKSYRGVKSAKFAARSRLKRYLHGFEVKQARFENWYQTDQRKEGPRVNQLIEAARKKIEIKENIMSIRELTPEGTIKKWKWDNFNEVPGHEEKLLFLVESLVDCPNNLIYDVSFPDPTFTFHRDNFAYDFFDVDNVIEVSDATGEVKGIQIANLWKLIDAGCFQKYFEMKEGEKKKDCVTSVLSVPAANSYERDVYKVTFFSYYENELVTFTVEKGAIKEIRKHVEKRESVSMEDLLKIPQKIATRQKGDIAPLTMENVIVAEIDEHKIQIEYDSPGGHRKVAMFKKAAYDWIFLSFTLFGGNGFSYF